MAGKISEALLDELFVLAKEVMQKHQIYPYVAMVVKNGEVISRGDNTERETRDVTNHGDVTTIRRAQLALDTGDLSGYTLLSLFEPTILGFDVALWAGITSFAWCINSESLPKHYHKMRYNPLVYAENNHGKIEIDNGMREKAGLALVKIAKEKKLYPDNLL